MFMKIATVGNFVILEQFFSPTVGQGLRDLGMLTCAVFLFFLCFNRMLLIWEESKTVWSLLEKKKKQQKTQLFS